MDTTTPPTAQQRLVERQRPSGPVVMYQRWEQLLFLHWKWDADLVQRALPPGLRVDRFDGAAWLGVVPLFMRDVRPRFTPSVPMISNFLELNVRTYVYDALGRPGVYFFSLDCDQPIAVEMARTFFKLRYEHAAMQASIDEEGWVSMDVQRSEQAEKNHFRYRGYGPAGEAFPESIEFFLIERYRLFASDGNGEQLNSVRICHAPYLIRQAQVTEWSDGMLRLAGFDPKGRAPDHICYSAGVEMEAFAPEKVEDI